MAKQGQISVVQFVGGFLIVLGGISFFVLDPQTWGVVGEYKDAVAFGLFCLGVIILMVKSKRCVCPKCREMVHPQATRCPRCHADMKPEELQ
jgi:hypothetical protein